MATETATKTKTYRDRQGREIYPPELEELCNMMDVSEAACADGCEVEPDGTCPHGNPSWLLWLGMI